MLVGIFGGGLFVLLDKWNEWYDDRYTDKTIGGWLSKQNNIVVQLFPPTENIRSMSEMENFFINMASIFTNKSQKDIYVEGKWHENYSFEVHSRGGQVNFFVRLNENHLPLLRSALAAHYPTATVVKTQDPFENWPKEWEGQVGPYTDIAGSDINFGTGNDLHPLKSWKEFQRDDNTPVTDPFSTLITGLENIKPEDYVVMQYVLRPRRNDDKIEEWGAKLKELRKKFKDNANVEVTETGGIQLLTKNEQNILNAAELRIGKDGYQFKFRAVFLTAAGGPNRLMSPIMSYFKQYTTDQQFVKPAGETKTSASAENRYWGPWWDKVYWAKEQEFRKKMLYKSLIGRSMSGGSDANYIDVESLASVFHFPSTELIDQSLASRVTTDYGNTEALPSGTPPRDLPI